MPLSQFFPTSREILEHRTIPQRHKDTCSIKTDFGHRKLITDCPTFFIPFRRSNCRAAK
jgi:hypothetical protein